MSLALTKQILVQIKTKYAVNTSKVEGKKVEETNTGHFKLCRKTQQQVKTKKKKL